MELSSAAVTVSCQINAPCNATLNDNKSGILNRAVACIHAGRLHEAEALCRQVLARDTRDFNALQLLGHCSLQARDYANAAKWLMAARAVNRANAPVLSNLAVALLALERPHEALECCEAALRLNPRFPEAFCNRGHALSMMGRPGDALVSYDRALAHAPAFQDAWSGRAKALLALARHEEALSACDRLLLVQAPTPDAWCLRGSVLLKLRRPEDALTAFDRAISMTPESAEAHNNRGTALRDLRRPREALEAYERAAHLRSDFPEVWCNAANLSLDAGRYEEALVRCDRALGIRPGFIEAMNIRGTALRLLKRFEEAASTYQAILGIAPDYGQALSYLLTSRANLACWTGHAALAAGLIERVEAGQSASAPHAFLWICDSAATQLKCARRYSADQFPAATPLADGPLYRHDRLRIAYLSADFADHPVSHLIAGVLEQHDRERFETFGIGLARDPAESAMQWRLRQAFEHFEDVSEASDRAVAVRLRECEIDVAVDLTGHTRGGRLGILAFRPAPIQISMLGFAGTSGAPYMDYLIGDDVATPTDHEECFSEKIIRMPDSFMPNDDAQPIAERLPRRCDLGLPDDAFVFCAFNNIYKLNPLMFDIWMRLLAQVPGSILWLRSAEDAVIANLGREATRRDIDPDRLVFAPRMEVMAAHLARYRQADLFLDTTPYGAHATARDALWAGLPVLTIAGSSFASRVAASLLNALGLQELIASSLEEYEQCALRLARTPEWLGNLRSRLSRKDVTHRCFDTGLYRRHLEAVFESVCARRSRREAPESFRVAPLV
jgi:predicted O-linked N-acetylglucosamine transferase (SPINDLY family)